MTVDEPEVLINEFHQGQAVARRDGYRSDCPHPPNSPRAEAWHAGFTDEEGPHYLTTSKGDRYRDGRPHNPALSEAFRRAMLKGSK